MSHSTQINWRPTASLPILRLRAQLLSRIRDFFANRDVLEVETPLLCQHGVTDPHIQSITAQLELGLKTQTYYLQTSPEYAMKRLLSAGSGSIFQISKAFRQGDVGNKHNPEFTLLEWYRTNFDHHQLMDEMDAFLQFVLKCNSAIRLTCEEVYKKFVDINPHTDDEETLQKRARELTSFSGRLTHRNAWLELLFTHCIEPHLGETGPVFLYDFPLSQSALAKIRPGNPATASRFEVYFKGIELANGFHELQDAEEQRTRFEKDLAFREKNNLEHIPVDERFLSSLSFLPNCAGVALGIDRLMMIATKIDWIREVISFDWENA